MWGSLYAALALVVSAKEIATLFGGHLKYRCRLFIP
jgi:hypothetical protein